VAAARARQTAQTSPKPSAGDSDERGPEVRRGDSSGAAANGNKVSVTTAPTVSPPEARNVHTRKAATHAA
jgi:hypothetical protein